MKNNPILVAGALLLCVVAVFVIMRLGASGNAVEAGSSLKTTFSGRILGKQPEAREAFTTPWKYRAATYELYYDDSKALAKTAYAIARHAGDVDASMTQERFVGGVRGYHYTTQQVCTWLNDTVSQQTQASTPAMDEHILVGLLLQDGVLRMQGGLFVATGKVSHILAAAPGKTRSFETNLRHERLHVFWSENKEFREQAKKRWNALSAEEREEVSKNISGSAKVNESQAIEEWAVTQEETSSMSIE